MSTPATEKGFEYTSPAESPDSIRLRVMGPHIDAIIGEVTFTPGPGETVSAILFEGNEHCPRRDEDQSFLSWVTGLSEASLEELRQNAPRVGQVARSLGDEAIMRVVVQRIKASRPKNAWFELVRVVTLRPFTDAGSFRLDYLRAVDDLLAAASRDGNE